MFSLIEKLTNSSTKFDNPLRGYDILVLSPTPTFPLDQGNRKRIFCYCKKLKELGAKIHFVYYPFELWFYNIPEMYLKMMTEQWDSFFLLPTTIPIQQPPKDGKLYHHIDEWWDAQAIEPFLKWIFSKMTFDIFIVNYPFLSKAFEFTPNGVYKILDTHDKFTGRRELYESMNIIPEFFYTTADMEKVALDRADLIWAIKEEEAEFFRSLTRKPVVTLPHLDPYTPVFKNKSEIDDEFLIIGMVGARNKVNFCNYRTFFDEAFPIIKRSLAPVKIVIAGGVCEDLMNYFDKLPSNVELVGKVEDLDVFYSKVDLVLIPIAQSTGIKIKTIEALSKGLPVVAHEHAFEGIPSTHPFHRCKNMREIAEAIIEIAYNRSIISELTVASINAWEKLSQITFKQYDKILNLITSTRSNIIITINPLLFLNFKSLYFQHIKEFVDFFSHFGKVFFFFDEPLQYDFNVWASSFHALHRPIKSIISPEAAEKMGLTKRTVLPFQYEIASLSEIFKSNEVNILWLENMPQDIIKKRLDISNFRACYLNIDSLRLLNKIEEIELFEILNDYPQIKIVGNLNPDKEPFISYVNNKYMVVPYWKTAELPYIWNAADPYTLWIIASTEYLEIVKALWNSLKKIYLKNKLNMKLILLRKSDCEKLNNVKLEISSEEILSLEEIFQDSSKVNPPPALVLEVCDEIVPFNILRETLVRRAGTIWESFFAKTPSDMRTLGDIIDKICDLDTFYYRDNFKERSAYANDAGFCVLWNEIKLYTTLFGGLK